MTQADFSRFTERSGMVHQYRKIKVGSNFKSSISGIQHRHFSLSSTNVNYSWRTNSTFKTVNKATLRETNNFSQITCSNRRTMCIDDISNFSWKIASQKHLSPLLAKKKSWDDTLTIDMGAKRDLQWWQDAVKYWNGKLMCHFTSEVQIETDASAHGWVHN